MRLDARDRQLLALVDAVTGRAATVAGPHLACGPGCTRCCIGPFPISQLDAWRLRQGLLQLTSAEPARAAALRQRADRAVVEQLASFPGDRAGTFDGDDDREESFCAAFATAPCPALHPDTGTCDLYVWRPLACRSYGPPMRIGGWDLPPCQLCFTAATPDEIEDARQVLDVEHEEAPLTDAVEAASFRYGMTTVAFAIAAPHPVTLVVDRADLPCVSD